MTAYLKMGKLATKLSIHNLLAAPNYMPPEYYDLLQGVLQLFLRLSEMIEIEEEGDAEMLAEARKRLEEQGGSP
jgi:hypothetical protein